MREERKAGPQVGSLTLMPNRKIGPYRILRHARNSRIVRPSADRNLSPVHPGRKCHPAGNRISRTIAINLLLASLSLGPPGLKCLRVSILISPKPINLKDGNPSHSQHSMNRPNINLCHTHRNNRLQDRSPNICRSAPILNLQAMAGTMSGDKSESGKIKMKKEELQSLLLFI